MEHDYYQKLTLFAIVSLLMPMITFADPVKVNSLWYNLDDEHLTAEVTGSQDGFSYSGIIEIPSTITYNDQDYTVKRISGWSFSECSSLTSVVIPETVTFIGEGAFWSCSNLVSINQKDGINYLPNSITDIGGIAFSGCGITSITIPSGLTYLAGIFSGCPLNSIYIPENVEHIDPSTFQGNKAVTISVSASNKYYDSRNNCNAIIEKSSATLISGCENTVIPDGIETIENYAFWGCEDLTSINIPSSVTTIEGGAFHGCNKLERVDISSLVAWCNIVFKGDDYDYGGNPLCYGGKLYLNNKWIRDLEIPESITGIKRFAFRGGKFTSLKIHHAIASIGEGAFKGCSSLMTATLPEPEVPDGGGVVQIIDLNIIEKDAFCDCSALNSINFTVYPSTIGESAFAHCRSLTSVKLGNLTTIYPRTFLGCENLTTVNIPDGVLSIGERAFAECRNLSIELILPEGLKVIDNAAFGLCEKIEVLILPNSLTTIGDEAFTGDKNLRSLFIPSSVNKIGDMAFVGLTNCYSIVVDEENPKYDSRNNCNAIIETKSGKLLAGCRKTVIEDDVTSIEERAFSYLPNSIFVVPNSVETIKENAFGWCGNLKTLVIGNGVYEVGEAIHYGCVPDDVYCYATSVPITHGRAFHWDGPWLGTLHVPEESIEKYRTTAPWSQFPNIVAITGNEQFTPDLFISASFDNSVNMKRYMDSNVNVSIERTFHKDGKWNTLCLPFSVTAEEIADEGHPLHDATIVSLKTEVSRLDANGCLDVRFGNTNYIEAGKPYLVKWTSGDDLVDPVFKSVTLSCIEPVAVTFANDLGTRQCKFVGQFSPFEVTYGNIKQIVQLISDNQLSYLEELNSLYSCYAHFEVPTIESTGKVAMKNSILSYIGDVNGDGDVDIADAVCIVNHIVGKSNTTFIEAAADVNGDGDIDIADAVHIVNYVVGKINALAPKFEFTLPEPQ